ncbi:MAG: MAPEG family protein [Thalassobaculum sp.]|uniref:MAPEG family protein n=1 Tax=Thalassobaculum sp. TaxID=2022740 RepID=UPI0032EB7FE6
MALSEAQRGVLRGMLAAVAVTVAAIGAAVLLQPAFLMPLPGFEQRLAATLHWDGLVLACLVLAIGLLARHRFFTPADIDGSGLTAGTDRAKVLQAVLQNTLEQAVIAVLAHLLWTAATPAGWFAAVPAAAMLFLVGRICFALGYRGGAPARAFGFALTFYPTVLLTVVSVLVLALNAVR